jgi:uncharacterized protein (TIGR02391 family)
MSLPNFPTPEVVLEMEPEELAPFVLQHLKTQPEGSINRYNFTLANDHELVEKLGRKYDDYRKRLIEAWMWLEREGFVAPQPGRQDDWMYVTLKGQRILAAENFSAHKQSSLFPSHIDPVLIRNVKPLFIRGDYDTAIFRTFKEVEIRVRKKAKLKDEDIGVELMRKAFGTNGALEDKEATKAERDRTRDLFVGAIGIFKNPSSHREVQFDDVLEVIDIISFANQLLRMVAKR